MNLKMLALSGVGLFLVIAGIVTFFVIESELRKRVRKELVIDSADHKNFNDYADPYLSTASPYYYKIYMQNLTNPAQFLAGSAPVYDEVGPFVYRYFDKFVESEFLDGGNRLRFVAPDVYNFVPELSVQPTDQLPFVGVNPFYTTLVTAAGGSANVKYVFAQGVLGSYFRNPTARAAFATAPSAAGLCVANIVCNYGATAFAATSPMTSQQGALVLQNLLEGNNLVTFLTLANQAAAAQLGGNTALATQLGTQIATNFVANWGGYTASSTLAQYLADLANKAEQVQTAGYGTLGTLAIQKRTVPQWVFGGDPFADGLGLSNGFLPNNTVYQYVVRTGKDSDDFFGMNYYEEYQNLTQVTVWPGGNFSTAGRTRSTEPFQKEMPSIVPLYLSTAYRHIEAVESRDAEVKDVPVKVYKFDAEALTRASAYYGSAVNGMVNMAPTARGMPLHLCVPHMRFVPQVYRDRVVGMVPDEKYDTELFMEKITGASVKGKKQIQLNILWNFTQYSFQGVTPATGVSEIFLPMFYVSEESEMSDTRADDFKPAVRARRAKPIVLGVLVGIGGVLMLLGIALALAGGKSSESDETQMQEKNEPKGGNDEGRV